MTLENAIVEIYQIASYLAGVIGFSVGTLFWKGVLK